jgi:hemerythrin-like metal-binding protein
MDIKIKILSCEELIKQFDKFPYIIVHNNKIVKKSELILPEFEDIIFKDIDNVFNINNKVYNISTFFCEPNCDFYIFIDITNINDILNGKIHEVENVKMAHIGIDIIDEQHNIMCEIISNIEYYYKIGNTNLELIITEFLKLMKLTKEHFFTEERLMDDIKGNDTYITEHKLEHTKLLNQLTLMVGQLDLFNIIKIIKYLKSWMLEHTNDYDKRLVGLINRD